MLTVLTTKMREYRKRKGLSQQELADLVGCRRETVGKLEKGRYNPSLRLAMDIASELDATVYDLFFFSDDTEEDESKK